MEIVFATNNPNKLREIQEILGNKFEVLSLADIGFSGDIPETRDTLEGNALQKAQYIHERFGKNVFADDTGLEIEGLNGAPGVYSARYAGPECKAEDNCRKVMQEMDGMENRSARFRTIIALILNDKEYTFEGEVKGEMTTEYRGNKGFGYDPIFLPEGRSATFAEMEASEKNAISHRGRAVRKLADFLAEQ